jgi:hypothetical protein
VRRVLAAAVALGLLASCSSGHGHHGPQPSLVPWDPATPAALQARTGPPAPPCRGAQLRPAGSGFRFEPALSGGTGSATLRNAGPAACRLTGRPEVRLVGGSPQHAQRQTSLPAQAPSFGQVLQPAATLLALPAGGTATLSVDWRNWCVPHSAKPPVPPNAMRLTLPGELGSVDIGYDAVPSCDSVRSPSTLGVRPFQPAPLPTTAPWSSGEVTATVQPLGGGNGPLTARRGTTVGFAVLLHNPATAAVTFTRCPLFVEMLAPAGTSEAHQLRCGSGTIAPGSTLGFEMRIQVPGTAPTGNNGLFWELDPTGAQGPEVVSRVVVKP